MAHLVDLRRDGVKISINADQIISVQENGSGKGGPQNGSVIRFANGEEIDVDETRDSVRSRINH
jgi:hypothetical protein